jgi:hypothetical protein
LFTRRAIPTSAMQSPLAQVAAKCSHGVPDATIITQQIANYSQNKHYLWLPEEVMRFGADSEVESRLFHEVLSNLLNRFTLDNPPLSIPRSIGDLYERELERIKSVLDSGDPAALSFKLNVRRKDLAVLTFRLIPVGAEFAEPWSAIWKRQVLTSRASQLFKAVNFFMLKRNGFSPYFQLHMHQESHEDFHEEGCMQTFRRLAELLEQNPDHKGWFSSSWLIDPALEQISPHLSYLRTVPENNGGATFYMEDDPTGKTGALATSRTRRRMFKSGLYHPRIYLRVWPRSSAIAWWKAQVTS